MRPRGLERYPQEPIVWVHLSVFEVVEVKAKKEISACVYVKIKP